MAFVNEPEKHRTIDYTRNAILTEISHDRESNHNFRLHLNDEVILFSGHSNLITIGPGKGILTWNIFKISSEGSSLEAKQDIQDVITEAMQEFGLRYGKKGLEKIKIEFSQE